VISGLVRRTFVQGDQRTADPGGAVVIGGDYRALGVVRSLGRQGIPVWVLKDEHLVATASRYTRRSLPWPDLEPRRQVEYLLDLGRRHQLKGWVLIPSGDEAVALLARHHATLSEQFRLAVPPWDVTRWAYDKRLTHRLASDVGIDHARTSYPQSREEVAALDWAFPVLLKPAHKERQLNRFTAAKAWRIDDSRTLVARYDEARTLVAPNVIMMQELIPGGGESQFSYAALCLDGRPLASIVARRTRQYPVDFGRYSTFVETIDQPGVEEVARRLIAALRYTGLIEVELKRDPRDGRYKLLDLNPRVWGWHSLGRRAGVDFPYLQWQLIRGESVPELRARSGVRWVRMLTDLPAVAHEMRHGNLSPTTYLRTLRGPLEFAIFAADDPLPALAEIPLSMSLAWKRTAPAWADSLDGVTDFALPDAHAVGLSGPARRPER
jgi:predicted ATP-grasp superfamily ATP-dependent carboligase